MQYLFSFLFYGLSVYAADWLLPGVYVSNFQSALITAICLWFVYKLLKPLFIFLTLPITFLTLGIFYIFINAFMISIVSWFLVDFHVDWMGISDGFNIVPAQWFL